MSTESLAGKTVLVTGGARRIGRAIALTLAQAGADVAITFRTSQAEAAQTAAEIAALGRSLSPSHCDVRSEASVRAAVARSSPHSASLDILVNNAAVFASAALESLTLDQWDAVFETNTRGPFLVAREALPHLRAAHGRIVNMGSLGGLHPWAGHAHYCASKAALHMLTQAMAKAFAPDVSVNCVAPGWIEMPGTIGQRLQLSSIGCPMLFGAFGRRVGSLDAVAHPSRSDAGRNCRPLASPPKPPWAATAMPATSLRPSSSSPPAPTSSPAKHSSSMAASASTDNLSS